MLEHCKNSSTLLTSCDCVFSTTVFPFEGIFDLDSAAVVDTGFDVDLQKISFLSQILIKSNTLPV